MLFYYKHKFLHRCSDCGNEVVEARTHLAPRLIGPDLNLLREMDLRKVTQIKTKILQLQ